MNINFFFKKDEIIQSSNESFNQKLVIVKVLNRLFLPIILLLAFE